MFPLTTIFGTQRFDDSLSFDGVQIVLAPETVDGTVPTDPALVGTTLPYQVTLRSPNPPSGAAWSALVGVE